MIILIVLFFFKDNIEQNVKLAAKTINKMSI